MAKPSAPPATPKPRRSQKRKRAVVPKAPSRGANATASQRPPDAKVKRNTGDDERIAERRVKALDLRKAGASYQQIAIALGVDKSTAWDDVQAEMEALRSLATSSAENVRELELQRLDRLLAKLEAHGLKKGDHRAVVAAVRVAERRAKLLGLDAPLRVQPVAPDRPNEHKTDEELQREIAEGAAVVDLVDKTKQ